LLLVLSSNGIDFGSIPALALRKAREVWLKAADPCQRGPRFFCNNRQFLLKQFQRAKVIGYSHDIHNLVDGTKTPSSVQSRGTSQKNLLCVTDEMSPCQAVAIGGEKINREEGAKVRVFHAFPSNKNAVEDLRTYVKNLHGEGLNVKAATHGGNELPVP
jgi:hypothetical protein